MSGAELVDERLQQRRVPALDGVRGLAVAAVVAFHLGLHRVRGGLLGVDVFFVLSGYLITGLVLSEWRQRGDVSLRRFWARRARRLLPAMLLLLTVVAVVSRFTLAAQDLSNVRSDVLATTFYVANWHSIWAGHGYFAAFRAPSPLLHTWSLSVEEQFYLLWPLLATVALRRLRSSKWLLAISIAGALASAALMAGLSLAGVGADRLYYGTDTRAQCLFVGDALAGLMFLSGRHFTGKRFRPPRGGVSRLGTSRAARWGLRAMGLAGTVTLTAMCLLVDGQSSWLYRGGFFLVALSVAAIIAATVLEPRGLLARAMSLKPLTALGVISYGVYLWHWPVIVALTRQRTGLTSGWLLLVRTAATLVISMASFFALERPIRLQQWRVPKPAFTLPTAFAGLTALAIVMPLTTPAAVSVDAAAAGSPVHAVTFVAPTTSTVPDTTVAASSTSAPDPVPTSGPTTIPTTTVPPSTVPPVPPVPPVPSGRPVRVMIVGDSVASTLATGMAPLQSSAGFILSNQGYVGCGIARGGATSFKLYTQPPACLTWPQRWQGLVDNFHPDITLVLLGRWEVLDRVHDGSWMHIGQPAFDTYLRSELELATSILTSKGGRVGFLTAPCNNHELADLASPGRLPPDDAHRVDLFNQMQAGVVAAHPGWTAMVPLAELLCPGGQFERSRNGAALRDSDGVHLAPLAGHLFVQQLLPGLIDWLHQPAPA